LGVDALVEERFDASFAQLDGKEFIKLLQKKIPTLRGICVGEDFRFGCTRSGDTRLLGLLAKEISVEMHILPSLCSEDEFRISSTRIRQAISGGSMELTNDLLGVPYEMEGTLLPSESTVNYLGSAQLQLNWEPELKPCSGLYYVRYENKRTCDPVSQIKEGILYYPHKCAVSGVACQIHSLDDVALSPGDQIRMSCLHFSYRSEGDLTRGMEETFIGQEKKAAQEYFLRRFPYGH
jgi:riboflavin kinase/FMN adenylyltransferase